MSWHRRAMCVWTVLLAAVLGGCAAKEPKSLVVMTYNIRIGAGDGSATPAPPNEDTLRAIAALIRDEQADVVLLQEVDNGVARSGGMDQAALLARETGLHGVFADAIDLQGGKYGIAVLSRWLIAKEEVLRLPRIDYAARGEDRPAWHSEPRIGLAVTLATPRGKLRVLNTHLGITQEQRMLQVAQLADWLALARARGPVIFGGDLNATPGAAELGMVRGMMRDCYEAFSGGGEGPLTFPSTAPDRCIDYLFVSPQLKPVETRVLEARLSDHCAVVARVEW